MPDRPETGRSAVMAGFVEDEKAWKAEDRMDQGMISGRGETSIWKACGMMSRGA